MAIETRWYLEPHIFYIRLYGNVTEDDMREAVEESGRAVTTHSDITVHSITDLSDMTKMPVSLSQITEAVKQLKNNPVKGWALTVGQHNALTGMIGTFLAQLFGFQYRTFGTLEDGLVFLNKMDQTLPPLLPIHSEFASWLAAQRQAAETPKNS